jgi:hypothetical protein
MTVLYHSGRHVDRHAERHLRSNLSQFFGRFVAGWLHSTWGVTRTVTPSVTGPVMADALAEPCAPSGCTVTGSVTHLELVDWCRRCGLQKPHPIFISGSSPESGGLAARRHYAPTHRLTDSPTHSASRGPSRETALTDPSAGRWYRALGRSGVTRRQAADQGCGVRQTILAERAHAPPGIADRQHAAAMNRRDDRGLPQGASRGRHVSGYVRSVGQQFDRNDGRIPHPASRERHAKRHGNRRRAGIRREDHRPTHVASLDRHAKRHKYEVG